MKPQYTPRQLRRRMILWESVRNISLILFGGCWAMFLSTRDGIAMTVWIVFAAVALAIAVVGASRHEAWMKRREAGW